MSTNHSRIFMSAIHKVAKRTAEAFASGLRTASDGSIHTVKVEREGDAYYIVTWVDEDNSRRRLQQNKHSTQSE